MRTGTSRLNLSPALKHIYGIYFHFNTLTKFHHRAQALQISNEPLYDKANHIKGHYTVYEIAFRSYFSSFETFFRVRLCGLFHIHFQFAYQI